MSRKPRVIAIILCAGQGTRMGAAQNKVFLPLSGKPLLVYTIEAFLKSSLIGEVLLVAHPQEVNYCSQEIVTRYQLHGVRAVIAGGNTRHQSEQCALSALREEIVSGKVDVVVFHDGARPFVTSSEIDAVVASARETGGALLATALANEEVVAHVGDKGLVERIYPLQELWRAQTPQAFAAHSLLTAYERALTEGFEGTDTASSYERLGLPVQIVSGSALNFKITTPQDLLRAEALLLNSDDISAK